MRFLQIIVTNTNWIGCKIEVIDYPPGICGFLHWHHFCKSIAPKFLIKMSRYQSHILVKNSFLTGTEHLTCSTNSRKHTLTHMTMGPEIQLWDFRFKQIMCTMVGKVKEIFLWISRLKTPWSEHTDAWKCLMRHYSTSSSL